MHKFILFKSSYFLTWNDYSKHIKKQSIQKVVHITISSQLWMLCSSGLKYNISKYQTKFLTHPGPFKTFKEKSLTLKKPQFSTPCTLQVVLTTIKNIRDISDRFNIVWCLNVTWLYIFLPSLSLYKDQCDRTITTDIKENAVPYVSCSPLLPTPKPIAIYLYNTGLTVLDINELKVYCFTVAPTYYLGHVDRICTIFI